MFHNKLLQSAYYNTVTTPHKELSFGELKSQPSRPSQNWARSQLASSSAELVISGSQHFPSSNPGPKKALLSFLSLSASHSRIPGAELSLWLSRLTAYHRASPTHKTVSCVLKGLTLGSIHSQLHPWGESGRSKLQRTPLSNTANPD